MNYHSTCRLLRIVWYHHLAVCSRNYRSKCGQSLYLTPCRLWIHQGSLEVRSLKDANNLIFICKIHKLNPSRKKEYILTTILQQMKCRFSSYCWRHNAVVRKCKQRLCTAICSKLNQTNVIHVGNSKFQIYCHRCIVYNVRRGEINRNMHSLPKSKHDCTYIWSRNIQNSGQRNEPGCI